MGMNTIIESGASVHVGSLTAEINEAGHKRDAKVCLYIGFADTGNYSLHVFPKEAIRIADCLIQMAKEAQRTEMDLESELRKSKEAA